MAEKDYKPYPTVAPEFKPTPKITEHFPEVELSGAVGKALEIVGRGTGVLSDAYKTEGAAWDKLSATGEKVGNELYNRAVAMKQLDIQDEVDKATLDLYNKSSDAVEAHGSKLGEEAVKGAPAVRKNIEDMRAQIASGLTSEVARREFNGKTLNIIGSDYRAITKHAREQDLALKKTTHEAMVENLIDRASRTDNDKDKADIMKQLDEQIDYGHSLYGRPGKPADDPVTIMQRRTANEKVTAKTINLGADKSPPAAWAELNRAYKAGEVSPEDYPRLRATIESKLKDEGVRGAVDEAWDPKGGLEDMSNKAAARAAEYATKAGTPQFASEMEDMARQGMHGKFAKQRTEEEDTWRTNTNNFIRTISGKDTNQWIYTKQQLFAATGNPKQAEADFDALPPERQKVLEAMMREGPKGGPETPAARNLVNQWKYALDGLGTSEQRLAAMSRNPYDPKENLPIAWANELRNKIEEQEKIGKEARDNPHISAAIEVFDRFAPGVLKDKTTAQYAAAVGELSSTVQAKANLLKRNLTYDENKEAVLTVIRNQHITLDAGSPLTVPSEEWRSVGYIKAAQRMDPGMTEQQVKEMYQQWILYGQYRALMEKTAQPSTAAPATAPVPAKPPSIPSPFSTGRMSGGR